MGMLTTQGHRARFPGRAGSGLRSLTLEGLVTMTSSEQIPV